MRLDPITLDRLGRIHPFVADKVRHLIVNVRSLYGLEVRVVQGLRSFATQAYIYGQGRTIAGPLCVHDGIERRIRECQYHPFGRIVTKCKPGWSWHNFGMAADLGPDNRTLPNYQVDWDDKSEAWKWLESEATKLDFVCGSRFRTFPDKPHFQMTGRFPVNPSNEVRELFEKGGLKLIWIESKLPLEVK